MSEQTMKRFRAKPLQLLPGSQGPEQRDRHGARPADAALRRHGIRAADRVRETANLLLARSAARAGEMAVRLSIGAARWQLVGHLLTERCCSRPSEGPRASSSRGGAGPDGVARLARSGRYDRRHAAPQVMAFAAALAIGTGVLFGLFPALHSTRPDLISSLKGQAGQPSGARAASRFRTSLATAQIALSMALLVVAGLFTRSLMNVSRVDLGLNADSVVMFSVSPAHNGYTPERSKQLFERLEDALAAIQARRRDRRQRSVTRRRQLGQLGRRGGLQGRTGHRRELERQLRRARLLPHARHSDHLGTRVHAAPTPPRHRKSSLSTRRSRRSSTSAATPSAST